MVLAVMMAGGSSAISLLMLVALILMCCVCLVPVCGGLSTSAVDRAGARKVDYYRALSIVAASLNAFALACAIVAVIADPPEVRRATVRPSHAPSHAQSRRAGA